MLALLEASVCKWRLWHDELDVAGRRLLDKLLAHAASHECRDDDVTQPRASGFTSGAQRATVEQTVDLYAELAISVSPLAIPRVVPGDVNDDHVIAVAVAGYGNRAHQ